jgi:hypothetical protein
VTHKPTRVNPYAIRRIVDAMPVRSTEADVRARARACCVAGASKDFIQRAEEAAVRYFRSVVPVGREA